MVMEEQCREAGPTHRSRGREVEVGVTGLASRFCLDFVRSHVPKWSWDPARHRTNNLLRPKLTVAASGRC
jgi:hypothetical protein